MLAYVLRVDDFNDYGCVTRGFDPLLAISWSTGVVLAFFHHGSAHMQREGFDAVLNATAISGFFDNVFIFKRDDDNVRMLSSVQRIGPDLAPIVVVLDAEIGVIIVAGSKRDYEDRQIRTRILAVLEAEP